MKSITDDLSLRKQNMFSVEMNPDEKNRSDWRTDNNNLTSRESSSPTFVRIFADVRCHYTLTCEDAYRPDVTVLYEHRRCVT